MISFLLTILLLTIIPDIIIWHEFLPPNNIVQRLLLCIPSLITWGAWFGFRTKKIPHNFGLRLFFGSLLLLAFPKFIFAFLSWPLGYNVGFAVSFIVLLFIIYGFTFGWLKLSVKNETFEFTNLPKSFDGYRILHISDLHIGSFERHPKFVERLVKTANEQKADLIVFTGDLINIKDEETHPFANKLSLLQAKDGIISILGNHDNTDKQRVIETERKMGWKVLINESHTIEKGAERINIIGVEQISMPPFRSRGDLNLAMKNMSEETFKILLTHDPSHWRMGVIVRTNIALTLSGHTHAAQMKIGRLSPARTIYREWGGKYTENEQILYVSFGLGGTIPFRLGAWPEINLITLKRKDEIL